MRIVTSPDAYPLCMKPSLLEGPSEVPSHEYTPAAFSVVSGHPWTRVGTVVGGAGAVVWVTAGCVTLGRGAVAPALVASSEASVSAIANPAAAVTFTHE